MTSFDIPNPTSVNEVADWVEFYIAFLGKEISKSELKSHVELSSSSDAPEEFIDSVWLEMERRAPLYGDEPPFEVQERLIISKINWEDIPEYVACLIFSIWGNSYRPKASGKLFERITNEAIKNFLRGESAIYGHPRGEKLQNIAGRLVERFVKEPPRRFKDRGLDVIAWKPFSDKRPSQIIILLQCAAGENWRSKTTSLCLFPWLQYMEWAFEPMRGFSVPRIISDRDFHDVSAEGGLLLDRPRIYRNMASSTIEGNLRDKLKLWCKERLRNMNS